jgi:quercetin dioxygenase-like cupin family protein
MSGRMMSKAESSMHELVSSYALNALDPEEKAQFEEHLHQGCDACDTELRAFTQVANAIGQSIPASPPLPLRERLRSRLGHTPQVPGVLLQQSGLLISRSDELSWRTLAPGIAYKVLYEDSERRYNTSLVRMESGVCYPSHRHSGVEELFVLSGDLHVEGQIMHTGDYCRAASGTIHGETYTETGCLFLLMASQENELLTAQSPQ